MAHDIPKLSLVAQFDDLCRVSNSLMIGNEDDILNLVKCIEENRMKWHATVRELAEAKLKLQEVQDEKSALERQLKPLRAAYSKEVQLKNKALRDVKLLREQIEGIRRFVMEDPTQTNMATRDKVLSYINLNKLQTLEELDNESESDSVSLDYDQTDDSIDMTEQRNSARKSNHSEKRKSTGSAAAKSSKISKTDLLAQLNDDNIFENGKSRSEPARKISYEAAQRNPISSDPATLTWSSNNRTVIGSHTGSTPIFKSDAYNLRRTLTTAGLGKMVSSIDQRQHAFIVKKVFKPENCGCCGKRIGFCSSCFKCNVCRATCHIDCKDKVPLPCVAFSTPSVKRTGSRRVLIADFAPQNTRPMIPALIVHCCNEIEKRGLDEIGLYRLCASDKEVRELKEKILNSKTGMPNLAQYEITLLCCVVKRFLGDLDEPLVTYILWRDFVNAAEQTNEEDRNNLIVGAISELPTANRDTLSFLMTHLKRVAKNSEKNKMNEMGLSKIFGPTIVGNSAHDIPANDMLSESAKQANVVMALFKLDEDLYNNMISRLPTASSPYSPDAHRLSVGTRLFGNSVCHKEPMTPARPRHPRTNSNLTLRPMF